MTAQFCENKSAKASPVAKLNQAFYLLSYMRTLFLSILLIALGAKGAWSQPGGGGGLFIQHLYTTQKSPIALQDKDLSVRSFMLKNGRIGVETHATDRAVKTRYGKFYYQDQSEGILLQPSYSLDYTNSFENTDQRLLITYKGEVTIIDFIGIIGENGAGHIDLIDSLVLGPGHFTMKRTFESDSLPVFVHWQPRAMSDYLDHGITPTTIPLLKQWGVLSYKENIDLSFLELLNLSGNYKAQAEYYFTMGEMHQALTSLRLAQKAGAKSCETCLLATNVYQSLGDLDSAVASLSEALSCKRLKKNDPYDHMGYYRQRAELYVHMGRLEEAAADYNSLVDLSKNSVATRNERALFHIEITQNYAAAVQDLQKVVDEIDEKELIGCGRSLRHYSTTYFNLGRAEYAYGHHQQAFEHWVKAAECRFQMDLYRSSVTHFDSMLVRHPNSATLHLARAMALQQRAPYQGSGTLRRLDHAMALKDLRRAEELGITDYRVYQLRALSLHVSNEHEAALRAVNLAIEKAPENARLYSLRYQCRRELGLAQYGDHNDPDLLKSEEVCAQWQFSR